MIKFFTRPMQPFMTGRAKGNQVAFNIGALLTAQLFVVDLQILLRPADLTSPTVPFHHLLTKLPVRLGSYPQARLLGLRFIHLTS
jgi:hypothetical protein